MIRNAGLPIRKVTTTIPAMALLFASLAPLAAQSPNAGLTTLPGHVIRALPNATPVPHTPQMDEQPITVTVVLNLTDPAGAAALEQDIADPNSANFQHTIGASDFTARFGPSQQAYDTVLNYLQQFGLTLSEGSQNRRTLTVTGTRGQAQRAFNVVINDYQLGTRTFHAVASDPSVPGAVAPLIAAVAGLNNLAVPTPAFTPFPFTPISIATAYGGTLTPAGKTNSSGLPPGLDGKGQTIGLIEFDGFNYSDVSNWLSFAGLPSGLIKQVSAIAINGGTGPSGCTQYQAGCGTTEVLLDIEAALGIAQGANIVVFDAPSSTDLADAVNQAGNYLTYGSLGTLSMSWDVCEDDVSASDVSSIDSVLSDFTAWGITLFVATGDNGSTCKNGSGGVYANTIAFPADAPHAIAVGGTALNVNSNNTYNTENWWLNSGGFGVSFLASEPGYQTSLYPGATGRSVPDVSMDAAPGIIVCQATTSDSPDCGDTATPGKFNVIGGTSLATPLWAATWALAQQAMIDAGGYQWSPANAHYFYKHDVFHSASSMTGTGNDFVHVGLGSPRMTKLVAVANPPRIDSFSPLDGPGAGGTKVTIVGAGFIGVKKVTFGGVDATKLTIHSDTKLTVETPAAPNEEVTLKLETPGGTATAAGLYTYDPEITGVSPDKGPLEGGTSVTVTGRALSATTETFVFGPGGTAVATKLSCSSSTKCTMRSPAHAPGTVDIEAQTAWGYGYSPLTSADRFTYQFPSITGFSPAVGPTTGGLFIYITGTSMNNRMIVDFGGGANGTGVYCSSTTTCGLYTPAHAAGVVYPTITVDGITSAPSPVGFKFVVFPTVTSISPNSIPESNSTSATTVTLTITGTGFSTTAGATVFNLNGSTLGSVVCTSSTQCTATLGIPGSTAAQTLETNAVTVTVGGKTSTDSVNLTYPVALPPPPPCTGTTCM